MSVFSIAFSGRLSGIARASMRGTVVYDSSTCCTFDYFGLNVDVAIIDVSGEYATIALNVYKKDESTGEVVSYSRAEYTYSIRDYDMTEEPYRWAERAERAVSLVCVETCETKNRMTALCRIVSRDMGIFIPRLIENILMKI